MSNTLAQISYSVTIAHKITSFTVKLTSIFADKRGRLRRIMVNGVYVVYVVFTIIINGVVTKRSQQWVKRRSELLVS